MIDPGATLQNERNAGNIVTLRSVPVGYLNFYLIAIAMLYLNIALGLISCRQGAIRDISPMGKTLLSDAYLRMVCKTS